MVFSVPENRLGQRGLSTTNARHGPRELVLGHCPLKGCRVSLELDDLEGRIDSPPRPPRPVLPFGDNGAHSYRSRRPSAKVQAAGMHARASHAPTLLEARVCTGDHAKAAVDLARLLLALAALPISPFIAQEHPKGHDDDVDDECHGRQMADRTGCPAPRREATGSSRIQSAFALQLGIPHRTRTHTRRGRCGLSWFRRPGGAGRGDPCTVTGPGYRPMLTANSVCLPLHWAGSTTPNDAEKIRA